MTRKEEIEARKMEIREEVEATEDESVLDELNKEVDTLNEEIEEIEEHEEKEDIGEQLEEGEVVAEEVSVEEVDNNEERKGGINMEYRTAYLKKLQGKELNEEERSALVSANAAIPTETMDTIFEKVVKKVPMLDEITLLRVKGNVDFYVEGTRTDGVNHTEAQSYDDASITLTKVSLAGTEVVKKVQISDKVREMSIDAFEGWLTDMLADSIANAIEAKIFGAIVSGGTSVEGEITADNIRALVAGLPAGYEAGAAFYCNKAIFYNKILKLQDLSKNELVYRDGNTYYMLGYPVKTSDKVSNLIFGNAKKFVGILPEEINVKSVYDIDTNTYKYAGIAIWDGKVAIADAFQVLSEEVSE